jgi:hypothetical protein
MNGHQSEVETLFEKVKDYGLTTVEVVKLQAINWSAIIVAEIVSNFIVLIVICFSLLLFDAGVGFWLGKKLGSYADGFMLLGLAHFVIAIVLYLFRLQIMKKPVREIITTKMLKAKEHADQ